MGRTTSKGNEAKSNMKHEAGLMIGDKGMTGEWDKNGAIKHCTI